MAGIIKGQMQVQPANSEPMEQEKPMQAEQAAPAANDQPDPASQEMYDKVIAAAGRILYDDKNSKNIVDMLKQSANDPASAIATVTVSVMATIVKQSGGNLAPEIILSALEEIAELVAELGQESKSLKVDDSVLQAASAEIVAQAIQAGIITQEMIQGEIDATDETELQNIMAQYQGAA